MSRNRKLDRFAEVAHPLLMRYMNPTRHCIGATWVTCAVLKELNIAAEPVPMKLRVLNKRLVQFMTRQAAGKPVEWEKAEQEGAWEVAIGFNTPEEMAELPGAWNGHLVAYVPSRGVIVDSSLSQTSRPEKEIVVPDVGIFAVGRRMPQPGVPYNFVTPTGEIIVYEAIIDEVWRGMPEWRRGQQRYKACVQEIVAQVTT